MIAEVKFKPQFGSHLPLLLAAYALSEGPVLELGLGYFSTPVLHWLCARDGRELVSYDSNPEFYKTFRHFRTEKHALELAPDWAAAPLEQDWGLVLVDHHPAQRRKEEIKRLANCARLLVVHDAEGHNDKHYRYSEVWPLFRFQYYYHAFRPHSKLVSNFVDLSHFKV